LTRHRLLRQSNPLLAPNNPLESLLRNLVLRRRNHRIRIRVRESTTRLSVLLASRLSRAHAVAGRSDLTAAGGAAVGIRDAAAGDELRTVARADVLGACVVGRDLRHGDGGHWGVLVYSVFEYLCMAGVKRWSLTGEESGDGETHIDGFGYRNKLVGRLCIVRLNE